MDKLPSDLRKLIFQVAGGDFELACCLRLLSRSWLISVQRFHVKARVHSLRKCRGKRQLRTLLYCFPSLTELYIGFAGSFDVISAFTNLCTLNVMNLKKRMIFTTMPVMSSLTSLSIPLTLALFDVLATRLPNLSTLRFYDSEDSFECGTTRVWPELPSLTSLQVGWLSPINRIFQCSNLQSLCIRRSTLDYQSLSALKSLSSLDIWLPLSVTTIQGPTATVTSLRILNCISPLRSICEHPNMSALQRLWLDCSRVPACDFNSLSLLQLLRGASVRPLVCFFLHYSSLQN